MGNNILDTAETCGNPLLRNRKTLDEAKERKRSRIAKIAEDLRYGRKVTDFRFDQIYPSQIRKHSETHWTPVEVALRAAELLAIHPKTRVLDIGSGCGKFCVIGAMSTPGQFIGIEQRPFLVQCAQEIAKQWKVQRACFLHGDMANVDWNFFDAFYLFNPFYEHRMMDLRIDDTICYDEMKYTRSIRAVESYLKVARVGTRVVTYHGFGGEIPPGYECIQKERGGTGTIELWVKVSE